MALNDIYCGRNGYPWETNEKKIGIEGMLHIIKWPPKMNLQNYVPIILKSYYYMYDYRWDPKLRNGQLMSLKMNIHTETYV